MSIVRRMCCVVVLCSSLCCCSGCATILGGIIGHQSGEACAGMAIGAAVDFGGCIIDGVGGLFTENEKEFQQKSVLNSENGQITLPIKAFSVDRTKTVLKSLQEKLTQDGWTCRTTMMKSEYKPKYRLDERWTCEDTDSQTFDLYIKLYTNHDSVIRIEVPEGSRIDRSAMTIHIYQSLENINSSEAPST